MTTTQHIEALADQIALDAHARGFRSAEDITKFTYTKTEMLPAAAIAEIVDLVLNR